MEYALQHRTISLDVTAVQKLRAMQDILSPSFNPRWIMDDDADVFFADSDEDSSAEEDEDDEDMTMIRPGWRPE